MSKKKGLSFEEKRQRMLHLFYEKKDVFTLKELEKIAPKEKGITLQTVKEVVQSLVDDSLVDSDKIGSSIYFWSFPSNAFIKRNVKIDELQKKIDETNAKINEVESRIKSARSNKEDTEERRELLELHRTTERKRQDLEKSLKQYECCDDNVLQAMKSQLDSAKQGADRWTDNVLSVISWCKKKFPNFDEKAFKQQYEIDDDFDYVE